MRGVRGAHALAKGPLYSAQALTVAPTDASLPAAWPSPGCRQVGAMRPRSCRAYHQRPPASALPPPSAALTTALPTSLSGEAASALRAPACAAAQHTHNVALALRLVHDGFVCLFGVVGDVLIVKCQRAWARGGKARCGTRTGPQYQVLAQQQVNTAASKAADPAAAARQPQ
jgi:hypothetical protein